MCQGKQRIKITVNKTNIFKYKFQEQFQVFGAEKLLPEALPIAGK
jgi:hypothetical protein